MINAALSSFLTRGDQGCGSEARGFTADTAMGHIPCKAGWSRAAWLLCLSLSSAISVPGAIANDDGHGGAGEGVIVERLVQESRSWDGTTLPAYPPGQPEVTVLRITIPAGVRLASHQHPVINAGVLLQGRLRVESRTGQVHELSAGDALVELVNRSHRGISLGPEPAVILVVYAGAKGVPTTVLDKPSPKTGL